MDEEPELGRLELIMEMIQDLRPYHSMKPPAVDLALRYITAAEPRIYAPPVDFMSILMGSGEGHEALFLPTVEELHTKITWIVCPVACRTERKHGTQTTPPLRAPDGGVVLPDQDLHYFSLRFNTEHLFKTHPVKYIILEDQVPKHRCMRDFMDLARGRLGTFLEQILYEAAKAAREADEQD